MLYNYLGVNRMNKLAYPQTSIFLCTPNASKVP
jgi:hypothetical protein